MGTRELLTYLEKLEIGLSSFSYEELGAIEAGELKRSFDYFKSGLEHKVFGISEMKQLDKICGQVGIERHNEEDHEAKLKETKLLLSLIDSLGKTNLSSSQTEILESIRKMTQRLYDKNRNPLKGDAKANELMTQSILEIEKDIVSNFSVEKINLKPVLTECMGQMELLEELVRLYKQNILEFIGGFKIHLKTESFDELHLACQKIQPCLRMMKTTSLLEITDQIINVCSTDNDVKHLDFLYDQFLIEYPNIEKLVDQEINVLRNM